MITQEQRPEKQDKQPGIEAEMNPAPEYIKNSYRAAESWKVKSR